MREVNMRCAGEVCMLEQRELLRFPVFLLLGLALVGGCRDRPQPSNSEIIMPKVEHVPSSPEDPAWQKAPEHVAKLLLQDIVEPRQLEVTTAEVRARALQDGKKAAFRLEWKDPSRDETPGPGRFSDGCALQTPVQSGPTLPAPQMGEPGRPVEIIFWNANWQALVHGRADELKALYPNAAIDHYPYEVPSLEKGSPVQRDMAIRYLPARALGNDWGGPRKVPVVRYMAEGPGTLTPQKDERANGDGRRTEGGWAVVITRDLPESSHVALAVWDGAQAEVGGRKMRTGWIRLRREQRR